MLIARTHSAHWIIEGIDIAYPDGNPNFLLNGGKDLKRRLAESTLKFLTEKIEMGY
jgi:hypothetical protein